MFSSRARLLSMRTAMKLARQLLETTILAIEAIADECSFRLSVTFRQRFHACFGVTPMPWQSAFRDNDSAIATTSANFWRTRNFVAERAKCYGDF